MYHELTAHHPPLPHHGPAIILLPIIILLVSASDVSIILLPIIILLVSAISSSPPRRRSYSRSSSSPLAMSLDAMRCHTVSFVPSPQVLGPQCTLASNLFEGVLAKSSVSLVASGKSSGVFKNDIQPGNTECVSEYSLLAEPVTAQSATSK